MEIKLNILFNEVLLMRTDEHGIENHDKVFIDKWQNILCVQCMNKIFFKKSPLYKKYMLFKSVNEIYSIKNCQDFRYHFSFFLLDHTLFLSNTFSYLEGASKSGNDAVNGVNTKDLGKSFDRAFGWKSSRCLDKISDMDSDTENNKIRGEINDKKHKRNLYPDSKRVRDRKHRTSGNVEKRANINMEDDNKKDCYADAVNNELITLATNACKEFLSTCSEDLRNVFRDAIYTCVLVRLKKFSTNKKKYFFIFKLLKNLMDDVEIIHSTLKKESAFIEEFMKLFVENYAISDNLKNGTEKKNLIPDSDKCLNRPKQCNSSSNGDYNRNNCNEVLLTLQIIFKLWCDNSLWQIDKELLKSFFTNLIINFKCTSKNTQLCNYYIEFIYIITKNYNDIIYFFNTIIFGTQKDVQNQLVKHTENNRKVPLDSSSPHCRNFSFNSLEHSHSGKRSSSDPYISNNRDSQRSSNISGGNSRRSSDNSRIGTGNSRIRRGNRRSSSGNSRRGSKNSTHKNNFPYNHLLRKNDDSYEDCETDSPEWIHKRCQNYKNENDVETSKNEITQSNQKGRNIYQWKNSKKEHNENYVKETKVKLKNVNLVHMQNEKTILNIFCRENKNISSADICNQMDEHHSIINSYSSDTFDVMPREEEQKINALFTQQKQGNKLCLKLLQQKNTLIRRDTDSGEDLIDINDSEKYSNNYENNTSRDSDFFKNEHNCDIGCVSQETIGWKNKKMSPKLDYYYDINSTTQGINSARILNYCGSGSSRAKGLEAFAAGEETEEVDKFTSGEEIEEVEKFTPGEEIEDFSTSKKSVEEYAMDERLESYKGGCLNVWDPLESLCVQHFHDGGERKEEKEANNYENTEEINAEEGRSSPSIFSKTSNTDSGTHNNNDVMHAEHCYDTDSMNRSNDDLNMLKETGNIQIFIILCDNLQETLLNHFSRDIQMKCLEIFYKFCSVDKRIVNIILSNTSLIEWVFDFLSNTKHECLREKALKFLVIFFIHNSLFSHTHAHYMIDVLIDIILKYVNKSNNSYNQISNDYSNFFHFLKALNMLIDISHASLKIFHVFKIINTITFIVVSPNAVPTKVKDIVSFFENFIFEKDEGAKEEQYVSMKQCEAAENDTNKMYTFHDNAISLGIHLKKKPYMSDRLNKQKSKTTDGIIDEGEHQNPSLGDTCIREKNNVNENFRKKLDEERPCDDFLLCKNGRNENRHTNDIMEKVYITNISALFKVLKTCSKMIKMVNANKEDVYVELIFNEKNDYLWEISVVVMKLLYSLIYILNKNERILNNLKIIDEQENTENGNELQILTFVKLVLYLFIDLHSFFRKIMKENNNPFKSDTIYFIKFLYLSCIFIFENICRKKKLFRNISTSLFFSSFFTPFFHLFSNVLSNLDDLLSRNLQRSTAESTYTSGKSIDDVDVNEKDETILDEEGKSIVINFEMYQNKMRKVLIKSKPFTLFFQYVSSKNYDAECYRILHLLIHEEDGMLKERENMKEILIEIINKHDFYFTKVLLFNFNDKEGVIETVIYIFYLCLIYDKKFIEKKLNVSREDNYVENLFSFNDYDINMNPLFLFMSLSYSYYFITKGKIASVFKCIKKEMHKINLHLWINIKKIKNIYFVLDCIFSLKISNSTYSNYFSFIMHVIKLELSLYTSNQPEQVDNRLYLSISKNEDLVQKIFENVEMNNIQNNHAIYVYYLIVKLRKYSSDHYKTMSLYKIMNAVIKHMHTIVKAEDEINDIFSFFFIFFENLEVYTQTDIFNIITVLQKLTHYIKTSLTIFFNKNANVKENIDEILDVHLKFENSFFYFIINLILFCRKYKQIQNIKVLSSSIALIQMLLYCIQFCNYYFMSLSFLILSLLILPLPDIPQKSSPLLMKVSTSFDKYTDEIIPPNNKFPTLTECDTNREKYVIRRSLFYPLVNSTNMNLRISSLSLLLSLLLTNDVVLLEDETLDFFIILINSSYLNEWNETVNNLLFAILNVLLLSSILNLQTKSFCFNSIYSFRPFFLRFILRLNRDQKFLIHKLFFLLIVIKIKPLWFDLKLYSEKILKIILNIVTKKDLDLATFHCISSLAYEAFLINRDGTMGSYETANKNVIDNLEDYLETYKKNIKDNDKDIHYMSSFSKFKCKHIDEDVVLAILNATRLLLYR
ncbi:hypothetical protein, conserved [Plasmodium gonderi]|uniref:Uncharacterized protein n=1 Tax=Plasmodium gonderi TaxID=77519 RepID=A0A1Y1JKQ9_PLAGO|nr:hypothetical protein, conserved [Plasmodium gonderi]GAW83106.1 hypothetical protein, conserved [Plasmodium gonderi]